MNNLHREKLCEIIKIYGKDACRDHKRIRGLLNDFCNGDYPAVNYLVTALEENVYSDLVVSSKPELYEVLSARLVKRLYTNRGMAPEIARWAVDSWALALGVISSETPHTELPVRFGESQTSITNVAKASTHAQQTIVVSPDGGYYTTISAAIRNAPPDALILVKPGHYYEGLVIDKRIQIKGDGPREQIIVEGRDISCIVMQTDEALVQGLTLRCRASHPSKKRHAVVIPMGRLKLIECDVTSNTQACVAVHGLSTHPIIQHCRLHDAGASGLFIEPHAHVTVEDCHIFRNELPGIAIQGYAHAVIKRCKVYGGRSHGILMWANGSGTIEDCDIYENACSGVKVRASGVPIVRECRIYNNAQQETWVYQNGMGNISFPKRTETPRVLQQSGNQEIQSEAIPIMHASDNAIYLQETVRLPVVTPQLVRRSHVEPLPRSDEQKIVSAVAQQPEKRFNLIDLFRRSIRLSKEK